MTVFTKPFPCPGRCVFCPSDVRMPKSYLASEPGCQRAEAARFDPYLQTWRRLQAYDEMGHATDKVELIVLGGTWSHYPEPYQRWFAKRCLDALNDFGRGVDRRGEVDAPDGGFRGLAPLREDGGRYNAAIRRRLRRNHDGALLAEGERASWDALERAQRENEGAAARQVGLVFETRPDRITPREVRRLRRLGATKLQIGVQSLDDAVLARSRRGHDAAASRRAITLARAAGFKIHIHWMPNLPGATPRSDLADFARLFADPAVRPDEVKIYPCSLVESAELVEHHARGAWRPYAHEELVGLLADCLARVPPWCRVTRMIRDIPSTEILTGNRTTNLREDVERVVRQRGAAPREIRTREVRSGAFDVDAVMLREHWYATASGRECFLEAVLPGGALAGFLRLALPDATATAPEEVAGAAMVRELHVYGEAVPLGSSGSGAAQHRGLGSRLVEAAAARAAAAGHRELAVIAAVGTRAWYRERGFCDSAAYPRRALAAVPAAFAR